MGYMYIDGRRVEFTNEKNVLSVIRKADIDLPTLCYHSSISTFGACRMCTCENEWGGMFAACSEEPRDGMVVYTNTPKVRKYRKVILELLLAAHERDCTTCMKNDDCRLLDLAKRMEVKTVRFQNTKEHVPLDFSSPSIVRDPNKCILCGDCVRTCSELQGIGCIDFAFRGTDATVGPAFGKSLAETDCVGCGQCRVACPTGAITIRTNRTEVRHAIADKNKKVVVQIAPAVRVAIGERFGMEKGANVMGKLVAILRRMGFDEVYDTNFSADLTIIEESKELVERLEKNENLPMFTSCCPGWVKFCELHYPEFAKGISTCRSPQQMFGAVLKEYHRQSGDERELVSVSIMPCTAKKGEILRPEHRTKGVQDVDYVLTTTEIIRMIEQAGIRFENMEDEAADMPFGLASGGGSLFGVTGGVTEAAVRVLVEGHSKEVQDQIRFTPIRGLDGIREAEVDYKGRTVRIAIVNGLANARVLLDKMKAGEASYDFVEVMACTAGCIMGGGQPTTTKPGTKQARAEGLYRTDARSEIRRSDENPMALQLYETILKGDAAHELLHNHKTHCECCE